jgi:hypothetical protein
MGSTFILKRTLTIMLSLTGYRLVLWNDTADMRQGFNGLSGIVCNHMMEDPFKEGTIYSFFNQRRTQVKLLVLCKYLHKTNYENKKIMCILLFQSNDALDIIL